MGLGGDHHQHGNNHHNNMGGLHNHNMGGMMSSGGMMMDPNGGAGRFATKPTVGRICDNILFKYAP
jgi:hypothetical protein